MEAPHSPPSEALEHPTIQGLELARTAVSQRPPRSIRPDGTQTWHDLLFVHWEVDSTQLRKVVPEQLELDTWEGSCLVGVVPFRMRHVRSWWMPRLFGLNFLETNLRTYVRYQGLPGVYFLSLEASSRLAVRVARWSWGLPYWDSAMSFETTASDPATHHARCIRRSDGADLDARFVVGDALAASVAGTLQHFLLERYLLFSIRNDTVWTGQVAHTPYAAHAVEIEALQESLLKAAQLSPSKAPPYCAHFSPGVDVEVFGPWPWPRLPAHLRELSGDRLPRAGREP